MFTREPEAFARTIKSPCRTLGRAIVATTTHTNNNATPMNIHLDFEDLNAEISYPFGPTHNCRT